jgi:hypothetical protein
MNVLHGLIVLTMNAREGSMHGASFMPKMYVEYVQLHIGHMIMRWHIKSKALQQFLSSSL